MAGQKIDPKSLTEAQLLYESSWLPVQTIEQKSGVSARSIQRIADRQGWTRPDSRHRKHFADRLWQSADRFLNALENQAASNLAAAGVRDLASLTKILHDLIDYETAEQKATTTQTPIQAQDLREKLRQKMGALSNEKSC